MCLWGVVGKIAKQTNYHYRRFSGYHGYNLQLQIVVNPAEPKFKITSKEIIIFLSHYSCISQKLRSLPLQQPKKSHLASAEGLLIEDHQYDHQKHQTEQTDFSISDRYPEYLPYKPGKHEVTGISLSNTRSAASMQI
jgi:hypothetical protein